MRILALLAGVLATVALIVSLIAGVGVWIVKEPARDRATHIFGRIDSALHIADQGLDQVKKSLAAAAERLDGVKEEQKKIAQQPQTGGAARRLMARTVQQRIAPELGNAHEKLHAVAEAAVVVNSVLEDVGSFPFLSTLGIEVGDLSEITRSLSQVESSAWELTRLFGEDAATSESGGADAQISRIEQTLTTMKSMLTAYESKVKQVRQRTDELQTRTLEWITPATIIISLASFWIALSQISVFCHARSWWKQSSALNSNPA